MSVRDRVLRILDLMLGAAFADGDFSLSEEREVRRLLATLLDVEVTGLPADVEARISSFDPLRFNLQSVAREFDHDPAPAKERLLELVGLTVVADGVFDPAEKLYLEELAGYLDIPCDLNHYAADALDIESLRNRFQQLRSSPPPMVTSAGKSSRPPPPPMVISPPKIDS